MSDTTNEADAVNLSNDESLDWMRQVQVQQRKCDEENSVLRNIYKRAKTAGENVKSMRAAIKATKLDPTEVVGDLRHQVRYMALRNIPITAEDLLAGWDAERTDKAQRADDEWDAGDRGYRDGRAGVKVEDCPYEVGTELHVAWYVDWQKGQASIARELGPDAQPADPSRARPKRGRQLRIPGTEEKATDPNAPPREKRQASPGKKLGRPKGSLNGQRRGRRGPVQEADGTTTY